MIRAVSRACASVIVVAKLFQLFQPIGGRRASKAFADAARVPPRAGTPAAAAARPAPLAAINIRRFIDINSLHCDAAGRGAADLAVRD